MMAKNLFPIALLLTLALGALPAAAEHRSNDGRDRKVEKIAHELVKRTHDLAHDAGALRGHYRGRGHHGVLRSLRELDDSARAFEAYVQRNGVYAPRTQHAFARLERAHARARHGVEALHGERRLLRGVERVDRLLEKLDTRLARIDRRRDGRRGYARSERWRGGFAWNF